MKFGIVTLYDSQNYGAYLQAYAMMHFLQQYDTDAEVEFVPLEKSKLKEMLFLIKTKNIPLAIYRMRQYLKYAKSRKMLKVGKENSNKHYNAIVIGSDTLWDVQNNSYPHYTEFLGYGISADKIIAYAPSAGKTSAKDFIKVYGKKATFDRFNAISVRDSNAQKLVKDISGISVPIVVDPTLLIEKADYPIETINLGRKYALIYSYGFKPADRYKIKRYCEKHSLTTVAIGVYAEWCDIKVTATVPQFLGYLSGAECVITSTFHGTIFSALFGKNFATFGGDNYKVTDILKKMGLENRNASVYEFEKILEENKKYNMKETMAGDIAFSQEFMKNSLQL